MSLAPDDRLYENSFDTLALTSHNWIISMPWHRGDILLFNEEERDNYIDFPPKVRIDGFKITDDGQKPALHIKLEVIELQKGFEEGRFKIGEKFVLSPITARLAYRGRLKPKIRTPMPPKPLLTTPKP